MDKHLLPHQAKQKDPIGLPWTVGLALPSRFSRLGRLLPATGTFFFIVGVNAVAALLPGTVLNHILGVCLASCLTNSVVVALTQAQNLKFTKDRWHYLHQSLPKLIQISSLGLAERVLSKLGQWTRKGTQPQFNSLVQSVIEHHKKEKLFIHELDDQLAEGSIGELSEVGSYRMARSAISAGSFEQACAIWKKFPFNPDWPFDEAISTWVSLIELFASTTQDQIQPYLDTVKTQKNISFIQAIELIKNSESFLSNLILAIPGNSSQVDATLSTMTAYLEKQALHHDLLEPSQPLVSRPTLARRNSL